MSAIRIRRFDVCICFSEERSLRFSGTMEEAGRCTSEQAGNGELDHLVKNKLGRGQAEHLRPLLSDTERAPAEISLNCSKGE